MLHLRFLSRKYNLDEMLVGEFYFSQSYSRPIYPESTVDVVYLSHSFAQIPCVCLGSLCSYVLCYNVVN